MISWVIIASIIAQPHIVPRFRKYERRRFVSEICNPCVWVRKEPVLKENRWLSAVFGVVQSDSEHSQDVTVFCSDKMLIANIFLLLDYLAECFVFVGVNSLA